MASKILEHVKKKHGVENPNQTLVDHLLATVTKDDA
jgi:predicted small metal-binding protein